MVAPALTLQPYTPIENIEVFINAVKKYGVYL